MTHERRIVRQALRLGAAGLLCILSGCATQIVTNREIYGEDVMSLSRRVLVQSDYKITEYEWLSRQAGPGQSRRVGKGRIVGRRTDTGAPEALQGTAYEGFFAIGGFDVYVTEIRFQEPLSGQQEYEIHSECKTQTIIGWVITKRDEEEEARVASMLQAEGAE